MTLKSDFYKAGTNTPVTIKSNMTLKDIDTYQYIGIKANKIHGEYVSKKRQFVIKFSDQTFITDWRKVIAWKYVWKGDLNWSYGEKNEEDTDCN